QALGRQACTAPSKRQFAGTRALGRCGSAAVVDPGPALRRVPCSLLAVHRVVVVAADQRVVRRSAEKQVVPGSAEQQGSPAPAPDLVAPPETAEDVPAGRSDELVVELRPVHRAGLERRLRPIRVPRKEVDLCGDTVAGSDAPIARARGLAPEVVVASIRKEPSVFSLATPSTVLPMSLFSFTSSAAVRAPA